MGPVREDEYEAHAERYDKQMKEKIGVDLAGKSVADKVRITRECRGWTSDGCPTPEHLARIGMDLPEVLEVVKARIAGNAWRCRGHGKNKEAAPSGAASLFVGVGSASRVGRGGHAGPLDHRVG